MVKLLMNKTETVRLIEKAILEAVSSIGMEMRPDQISIDHPANRSFGDYSTNVAMVLAKELKANPRELAQKIVEELQKLTNGAVVEKIEIAGAGFINFFLKTDYKLELAQRVNYPSDFRKRMGEYGEGKTMVIDYSAPNIAKPFGIGHLRSTNIGQTIYNHYQILGWSTIGDNHLGDWGTQFGKLITAIIKWGDKKTEEMTIEDLEKLYVKFHAEAEKDKTLIDEGREWFAKLEKGDKQAREIWQKCVEISLKEFDRVYQLLGVSIDFTHGESFYEEMLQDTVSEVKKKGVATESQGALIVEFKDGAGKEIMPPAMVLKSSGATTYFTRDLATIKYRLENWKPDLVVYEVGADQQLHFKQLFETARKMGWWPKEGMIHVAHGLIRWKTGKFSTRKGDTIHLEDVIEKAMEEAKRVAEVSLVNKEMTAAEKQEMIRKVGLGAIKFSDLSSDPKKDIIFDWDEIMNLEGDSGPYLQYTYARCLSVLEKSKVKETRNIGQAPGELTPPEEALVGEFYRLEEKILEGASNFSGAIVADYLLRLARTYNEFYAKNKIIGDEKEVFRLFLTRTTASILEIGLGLLNIETVGKM